MIFKFYKYIELIWYVVCHIYKYTEIAVIVPQHCCRSLNLMLSGFALEPSLHNTMNIFTLCTGDLFCQS